jgi:hypothetical protein
MLGNPILSKLLILFLSERHLMYYFPQRFVSLEAEDAASEDLDADEDGESNEENVEADDEEEEEEEEEETDFTVMRSRDQDELLKAAGHYQSLPHLGYVFFDPPSLYL